MRAGAGEPAVSVEVNLAGPLAELTAAFERYEAALVSNDVATLTGLFAPSPHTIRYGVAEILYGSNEIAAFRAGRPAVDLARQLSRTVITTYGRDFGTASTLFHRDSYGMRIGRQMQSWVRFPEGWRIVAAHVSVIPDPDQPT